MIRPRSVLQERMLEMLVTWNHTQKSHAPEWRFQNLGYCCLSSWYSTGSEGGLGSTEEQIEVVRRYLLEKN